MPHPRILIIEDHPLMADAIAVSVQSCLPQADCCFATSLASALAQLASHQPWVLVLVDLNLPDSQGLDTFHAVCQLRSQGAMLVLSALQDNAIKEACVANSVLFVDTRLQGEHLWLWCIDKGEGMSQAQLESCFKAFNANDDAAHVSQSLGLGLFSVKQLALQMQTPVLVRSQVGQGVAIGIGLRLTSPRLSD